MKKKFAVVKVFGYIGTFISIMSKDQFAETLCECKILFESDDIKEVSAWYDDFIFVFGEMYKL